MKKIVKKRVGKKPFKHRRVAAGAYLYRVLPELDDAMLGNIELWARVPLDAIKRGEGTEENVSNVQTALTFGFVLAAAFENKTEIQMLIQLAEAGIGGACRCIRNGEPEGIWRELFEPVDAALGVISDMQRTVEREVLVRCIDVIKVHNFSLRVNPKSAFLIPADERAKRFMNRVGLAYINGKARSGYLQKNDTMNRIEWVSPNEGLQIPITKYTLIVFAEPLK